MSAADTLRRLRADGFTVSTKEGRLFVGPRNRITDDIREGVRYFRASMIEALEAEARGEPDSLIRCVDCLHYNAAAQLCINHRRALLTVPIIGPALASLRQHCPGHTKAEQAAAAGQPAPEAVPGPHQSAESPASGPPAARTALPDAATTDAADSQRGAEGRTPIG